jgi:hypothetical protein
MAQARDEKKMAQAAEEKTRRSCLHKQLRKTKFCMYHLQGICQFGDSCAFAHSCVELQGAPDLRKTRLCKGSVNGICYDPECTFAHNEEELRSTDMFYKKSLCMWNEKGRCRNGDQCRFAHGFEELHTREQNEKALMDKGGGGGNGGAVWQPGGALTQVARGSNGVQRRNGKYTAGKFTSGPGGAGDFDLPEDPSSAHLAGTGVSPSVIGEATKVLPAFATEAPPDLEPMFVMQQAPLAPRFPQAPPGMMPPVPGPQVALNQSPVFEQLAQCRKQIEQLSRVSAAMAAKGTQADGFHGLGQPNLEGLNGCWGLQMQLQQASAAAAAAGGRASPMESQSLSQLVHNISALTEQLSRFEMQISKQRTMEPDKYANPALGLPNPYYLGSHNQYPLIPLLSEMGLSSHFSDYGLGSVQA